MALNQADILDAVRKITGNKVTRSVGELGLSDDDIIAAMESAIRDLNIAYGSSAGRKQVAMTLPSGVQSYTLSSIAADIYQIEYVLRERAYRSDFLFDDDVISPSTGLPLARRSLIDPGLQGDVFRVIAAQDRFRANDECTFEIFDDKLWVYPVPTWDEHAMVRYITNAFGIDTLPDDAKPALVSACVVAILNLQLNRIMSDRATGATHGLVSEERIKLLIQQRDYYQGEYSASRPLSRTP